MKIITNEDLIWKTDNYDVILVGTSIYCMLTNGFQSKMRMKYPYIDKKNDATGYGDFRKMGTRLTIEEKGNPIISLMYICNYPNKNRVFLDYDALENCLRTATAEFKGKKVATTVLGGSLFDGNGDKDKILQIMEDCTKGMDLDVYDYVQLDRMKEIKLQKEKIIKLKDTDYKKYQKLWSMKDDMFKKMYLSEK